MKIFDLDQVEGNAFALLGIARGWGRQIGFTDEQIEVMLTEMRSNDYTHLLNTFDNCFKDMVDYKFINDPREEVETE